MPLRVFLVGWEHMVSHLVAHMQIYKNSAFVVDIMARQIGIPEITGINCSNDAYK